MSKLFQHLFYAFSTNTQNSFYQVSSKTLLHRIFQLKSNQTQHIFHRFFTVQQCLSIVLKNTLFLTFYPNIYILTKNTFLPNWNIPLFTLAKEERAFCSHRRLRVRPASCQALSRHASAVSKTTADKTPSGERVPETISCLWAIGYFSSVSLEIIKHGRILGIRCVSHLL